MTFPARTSIFRRPWAGAAFALIAALGLAAFVAFSVFDVTGPLRRRTHPATDALAGHADIASGASESPSPARPADLQPAVLFACYEHARENTPPRTDTSLRQRAFRHPPPPLAAARAAFAAGASARGAAKNEFDGQLLDQLAAWDAAFREGRRIAPSPDLAYLLSKCSLPWDALLQIGLGMQYLDGDLPAASWLHAAIDRADRALKEHPLPTGGAGDPVAESLRGRLRDLLPQTAALWRANEYVALEKRFAIEQSLYPPLSKQSRKAAHSRAEALFYLGKSKDAADAINALAQLHQQAGDLTESDRYEFEYIVGLFDYGDHRTDEAIPHLVAAAQPGRDHSRYVLGMLTNALQSGGHITDADVARLRGYLATYGPRDGAAARVSELLGRRGPAAP